MIPSFITIVIRNKRNDNKNELLLDNDMDQNIANVMEDVITNHVTLVVSEEEDDADNEYSEDEDDDNNDDDDDYMMERTPTSTPEYDESSRMSMVDAVISFDGSNNNNCCVNMNTNTNNNNVDKIYYDSNSNSNRVRVVSYNDALFEDYDVMFPSDTSIMIVD